MYGHSLQNGIVLLKLESLGGVLAILGGDIAGSAGQSAVLHLGAFEYHLHSITFYFLCHSGMSLDIGGELCDNLDVLPVAVAFLYGVAKCGVKSLLVD